MSMSATTFSRTGRRPCGARTTPGCSTSSDATIPKDCSSCTTASAAKTGARTALRGRPDAASFLQLLRDPCSVRVDVGGRELLQRVLHQLAVRVERIANAANIG